MGLKDILKSLGLGSQETSQPAIRILVLEDDPSIRPLLSRLFQIVSAGAQLDWVAHVGDAVSALQKRKYSLVLADYYLQGPASGLDLFLLCKEEYPGLPVVMMSGIGQEAMTQLAGVSGAYPLFLKKPISTADFKATIPPLLSRAIYAR